MSEKRRTKREMERSGTKSFSMTVGTAKIQLTDKKVDILLPFKKITYLATPTSREYANYAMCFDETDDKEMAENYAKTLIGLEMLSSYAHSDANLAMAMIDVAIKDFESKMNEINAREDSEDENAKDAKTLFDMALSDMNENG